MKQEMKNKWLKALRSGEYAQTSEALCGITMIDGEDTVGYCCLGVLAKVAGDSFGFSIEGPGQYYVEGFELDGYCSEDFNEVILQRIGMSPFFQKVVVEMNDAVDWDSSENTTIFVNDFDVIADFIAANLPVD